MESGSQFHIGQKDRNLPQKPIDNRKLLLVKQRIQMLWRLQSSAAADKCSTIQSKIKTN